MLKYQVFSGAPIGQMAGQVKWVIMTPTNTHTYPASPQYEGTRGGGTSSSSPRVDKGPWGVTGRSALKENSQRNINMALWKPDKSPIAPPASINLGISCGAESKQTDQAGAYIWKLSSAGTSEWCVRLGKTLRPNLARQEWRAVGRSGNLHPLPADKVGCPEHP